MEEKEIEPAKKCGEMKEVKVKKEIGFWSCLRSSVLGGVGLASRRDDEYKKAIVKLEEVLNLVSFSFTFIFYY